MLNLRFVSVSSNIVWGEKIEKCSQIVQYHVQEGLRNAPSEFLQEAVVLQYAASGLQSMLAGKLDCNVFSVVSIQAVKLFKWCQSAFAPEVYEINMD